MSLKDTIKKDPRLKKLVLRLMSTQNGIRPRWWVRNLVNPFFHKRGRHTVIFRKSRLDLVPFNQFGIGHHSTIEDFSFVNNAMGPVILGNHVFIGASNAIIGPVTLHDHVMTAQNVVISGMNHGIANVSVAYRYQPCTVAAITIGEGSWIGANSVITAGVQIGAFAIVAAGSVVTKNIEPYTMAGGNPARVLKQFNHEKGEWEKV